jgi:hypothetical protein
MRELAGGARRRGNDEEREKGRGGRNLTTLAGVDVLRKDGRRWVAEEDDGRRWVAHVFTGEAGEI